MRARGTEFAQKGGVMWRGKRDSIYPIYYSLLFVDYNNMKCTYVFYINLIIVCSICTLHKRI